MASNGKNPNAEVIARSVTKQDYSPNPQAGYSSVLNFILPNVGATQTGLPPYWSPLRDRVLRTSIMQESMWASAIHIAISKIANRAWRLDGRRVAYWQDLLLSADNHQSFTNFVEKLAKDFLLTDNGCFFEVVRVNNARGARIIGIEPLASWRCIRTGDPDYPVIYRDRNGTWHEMRDYQVITFVDEPENSGYYNIEIGFCAASRAYSAIMKLSALEQYVYEKIAGKRPLSIYLVNAQIKERQLQDAVDVQKERSTAQGYVQYMGAVMIPILDPTATPQVAEIKIAGLPDGFDPKEERLQGQITYADAIGLDPTDLNPELAARGRALGSGSQAQVLDDKGEGKGIHSFSNKFAYMFNERILPARVQFSLYNSDLVDLMRRAQIRETNYKSMRSAVGNGQEPPIVTPEQAKNILVDLNELSPEYLAQDLTADETIRDTEKPSLVLNVEHEQPTDAKLMQTEPQPQQTFSPQQAKQKERALDILINLAEKEMMDVAPELTPMLTDRELLASYLHNHPEALKEITSTRQQTYVGYAKDLIATEKEKAQQMYRQQPTIVTLSQPQQPQPVINVTLPEIKLPSIVLPEIKVEAPQVTMKEAQRTFNFTLPEPQAPVVNVAAPQVNVTNEVQTPTVNVAAPNVEVTNEVPVPQVSNQIDIPITTTETLQVERGEDNLIQRIIKTVTRE